MAIVRKSPSKAKATAYPIEIGKAEPAAAEDARRAAIEGVKARDAPAAQRNPVVPVLLLEAEVAERLRCSTCKIKRLRLSGQLPFIPGRPVLIAETDVRVFVEALLKKARANRD